MDAKFCNQCAAPLGAINARGAATAAREDLRDTVFPTRYSSPSKEALLRRIGDDYGLGIISDVRFLRRGLNDIYLIEAARGRFIFRLYRTWRSAADVAFELEWLDYLAAREVPVIPAVRLADRSRFGSLQAPEGKRLYALFEHTGQTISPAVDTAFARIYGASLAELHRASNGFVSQAQRFHLNIEHLMERPNRAIHRVFQHRSKGLAFIDRAVARVGATIERVPTTSPAYGPCHGDTHFENLCIAAGRPLWLDFDCGGMGWRIYDLATFYWALKWKWIGWSVRYTEPDEMVWSAFVEAYQAAHGIVVQDWEAFAAFVVARHIWAVGLQASNADDWAAYSWLSDAYFDEQIAFIEKRATELAYDLT